MSSQASTPPRGWKQAWEINPPQPGDSDHEEYLRLLPAMTDYLDAVTDAAALAGPPQPTPDSNGHERVVPDRDPTPREEEDPGPQSDPDVIDIAERRERKRKTQGERIREAVDEADVDVFHDSEFRAYATFEHQGHRETWPVRSAGFHRYVRWIVHRRTGRPPRAGDLADVLGTIEGRAQFEGPLMASHVRIAPTNDGIAVDLGDPGWTAIEVDGYGWRHVELPSVRFVRPRGMSALPMPVRGGSIELLRPFINVATEVDWKLLVGFLLMMFRPHGPFPVLGLGGEQGSAKSTGMRVLRRLVDPRETLDRSAPRSDHDLAIHAMHNRVVALDNLSGLPDWLSDALARLATGSGFSTRQLYTDADEFSFSAARPVMLNGIGEVITRSDLLDRAVLVSLEPIPESARRLEEDFWAAFEDTRPRILGALLDAVSSAIGRESEVALSGWPRMADFARWVMAAEPALGWPDGSFLAAYYANRGMANEMALEADPVAVAVRELLSTTRTWEGSATALLDVLARHVGSPTTKRKEWPGAANALSNRLERLAPNLRKLRPTGIDIERGKGAHGHRTIRLTVVGGSPPPSPPTNAEEAKEAAIRMAPDRHSSSTGPPPVERGRGDGGDGGDPLQSLDTEAPELADLWQRAQDAFADLLPEAQA